MMRALLGILLLGLVGLIVYEWYGWASATAAAAFLEAPDSQSDDAAVTAPLPSMQSLGPLGDFAVVTERPLFNKDRRPIEKLEQANASGVSRNRPKLEVSAIVAVQDDYYAHARTKKGEVLRLVPGDEHQGWRVDKILSDRLVLTRDERREEFELRPFPEAVAKGAK